MSEQSSASKLAPEVAWSWGLLLEDGAEGMRELFDEWIAEGNGDAVVEFALSLEKHGIGTPHDAFLIAARSGDPTYAAPAALHLGKLFHRARPDLALQFYVEAAESTNADAAVAARIGIAELFHDDGDEAREAGAYRSALQADHPSLSPYAGLCLGDLVVETDPVEAERAWALAALFEGESAARAALRLAMLYREAGHEEDAEEYLRDLDLGAADFAASELMYVGIMLYETDPEEAKDAFRRALASGDPEFEGEAAFRLGYLSEDDPDLARALYMRAIASARADVVNRARYMLAQLNLATDRAAAVGELDDLVTTAEPQIAESARMRLALVAVEDDDLDRAERLVLKGIEVDPARAAEGAARLAAHLDAVGERERALALYCLIVENGVLAQTTPNSAFQLAVVLVEENREAAIAAFRRALDDPDVGKAAASWLRAMDADDSHEKES